MKVVYKYHLPLVGYTRLKLPYYSRILSAVNQYEKMVVYVLLDTEQTGYDDYTFYIVGTGNKIDSQNIGNFINTVTFQSGALVFHVFYSVYK